MKKRKRILAIKEAIALLEMSVHMENVLKKSLTKNGIALPVVRQLETVEARRQLFLRNSKSLVGVSADEITSRNSNFVSLILYEIASLLNSNQVEYFLTGPTLHRLIGSTGELLTIDHRDLQYSESLHIGIWKNNITEERIEKLLKSREIDFKRDQNNAAINSERVVLTSGELPSGFIDMNGRLAILSDADCVRIGDK